VRLFDRVARNSSELTLSPNLGAKDPACAEYMTLHSAYDVRLGTVGTAGITSRNSSTSKSYWTKIRKGIKLVNTLNEESVSQSKHGLEASPTTDSSLKPPRGECSPASRSPRAGFSDRSLSGHPWCPRRENPSPKTVEASDERRCYNSQPGEHRRSDFPSGDGAHGKEEVSKPPA
jgi:hypothetical protein